MSTDWTNRIKIDNVYDNQKSATFAKYAENPDLQWHTRPKDDQDSVLQNKVFHNYGAGESSAPTDWFEFSFQNSDSRHSNIATSGTYHATVIDQAKTVQPHLEMQVDANGDGIFENALTLAVWDKQSGWHDVPGQDIDTLIGQALNPLDATLSTSHVNFYFIV